MGLLGGMDESHESGSGTFGTAGDAVPAPAPRRERLLSLDALRGFDMFWITGGTAILFGLGNVIHRPFFDKFLEQFDHVPWQGLHLYDLIWPLFMFVMGACHPAGSGKSTCPR